MKPWIKQHTGIVGELKVEGALGYLNEDPHPWAVARYEHTKAENELKRIWAEVYGEQKGTIPEKETATDRDQRVVAARQCIAEAQLEVDRHTCRRKSAESFLDIYQTESANTRSVGKLT